MVIAEDLNADPLVIPATARAISGGLLADWEKAYAVGQGEQPSPTCIFDLDAGAGTRRVGLSQRPGRLSFLLRTN